MLPRPSVRVSVPFVACAAWMIVVLTFGQTPPPAGGPPAVNPDPWPRQIAAGDNTIRLYQPQVNAWDGIVIRARAAVAVQPKGAAAPDYGIIVLSARTDVDKDRRVVTLEDLKIDQGDFPGAAAQADAYLTLLRSALPANAPTVSLDRLQANLAVTLAKKETRKAPLKNDPPQIIFSQTPAVLVLIDGAPVLRNAAGGLLRVVNTRALLLLNPDTGLYYLHLLGRWAQSKALTGPWTLAENPPPPLATAQAKAVEQRRVDLLDGHGDPAQAAQQPLPTVYVSTVPAELIVTQGPPDYQPIDGTGLLYAPNTTGDLFLDIGNQRFYVLISGRWFQAPAQTGPWSYVPQDKLPADFAKIPETHEKADVLVSVAGTPQAQEALIANSIPQTATIKRSEAQLTVTYTGAPKFEPIPDTKLLYAVNTSTPVIQIAPDQFYAIENGVWFTATSPSGPWQVATSVPSEVYSIPPSSPLNYVTYAQVYGSTPDTVTVGYTPGYYGTAVSSDDTVVYGTGWTYPTTVYGDDDDWYAWPYTYGYGAGFGWNAAKGFALGFGLGHDENLGGLRPGWGPVGWGVTRTDGAAAGWGLGAQYGGAAFNDIDLNRANVYSRWGDAAVANRAAGAAAANRVADAGAAADVQARWDKYSPMNNHLGENNVFAGNDGNLYRQTQDSWESFDKARQQWTKADGQTNSWNAARSNFNTARPGGSADAAQSLNREWSGRNYGSYRADASRSQAGRSQMSQAPVNRAGGGGGGGGFRAGGGGARGGGGGGRR